MMGFRNATLLRLQQPADDHIAGITLGLEANAWTTNMPGQSVSVGFTELPGLDVRGASLSGGAFFCAIKQSVKRIPAAAIRELVEERVERIEELEGRKVFRKERLTLRDEVLMDNLPRVIPVSSVTLVMIEPNSRLVAVNSASNSRVEDTLGFLRALLGSFPVMPLIPSSRPSDVMTFWIRSRTITEGACFGAEAVIKDRCAGGPVVRIRNQSLTDDSVLDLVESGLFADRLQVLFGGICMTLCDQGNVLRSIRWPDVADGPADPEEDPAALVEAQAFELTKALLEITGWLAKEWGWLAQDPLPIPSEATSDETREDTTSVHAE